MSLILVRTKSQGFVRMAKHECWHSSPACPALREGMFVKSITPEQLAARRLRACSRCVKPSAPDAKDASRECPPHTYASHEPGVPASCIACGVLYEADKGGNLMECQFGLFGCKERPRGMLAMMVHAVECPFRPVAGEPQAVCLCRGGTDHAPTCPVRIEAGKVPHDKKHDYGTHRNGQDCTEACFDE